jgi:hypothetical protein
MTIASDSDDTQVYLLRLLVADCATFQAVVGESSKADALLHVYGNEAFDESHDEPDQWPRAIVELAPGFEVNRAGTSSWSRTGQLHVTFEFEIPGSDDATTRTQRNWFIKQVLAIRDEIMPLAGTGTSTTGYTHLNVVRIWNEDGPSKEPEEEQDQPDPGQGTPKSRWWTTFGVEWQG